MLVNSSDPGMFWSDLIEPMLSDEKMGKKYLARIPLGRAAFPEDFVRSVVFLAGSASSMVTAPILTVDGGVAGG